MQNCADGKTTMSVYERKASIRDFYGAHIYLELGFSLCCLYTNNISPFPDNNIHALSIFAFDKQQLYSLLCCNFKEASQIWKRGSRDNSVLTGIGKRKSCFGGSSVNLT